MKLIKWIKKLFSKSNPVGSILISIFSNAGRVILKDMFDPDTLDKAKEFVIELNANKSMSNSQKAAVFNRKIAEWLLAEGKKLIESQINLLRELAVNAIKVDNKAKELGLDSTSI